MLPFWGRCSRIDQCHRCLRYRRHAESYEVDLALIDRVVVASCTCPYLATYGYICKHIWAVLLEAEPGGFAAKAAATGALRLAIAGEDILSRSPRRYPSRRASVGKIGSPPSSERRKPPFPLSRRMPSRASGR